MMKPICLLILAVFLAVIGCGKEDKKYEEPKKHSPMPTEAPGVGLPGGQKGGNDANAPKATAE